MRTADVVIIGGGIVGVSLAYHLARRGSSDVVVLERDLIGSGSTSRANGGVRLQFATPLNIELSREAVRVFETFRDEFGVDPDFHAGWRSAIVPVPAAGAAGASGVAGPDGPRRPGRRSWPTLDRHRARVPTLQSAPRSPK